MCDEKAKRFGYRSEKRRYRCLSCNHVFFRHLHQVTTWEDFYAFNRYIRGYWNRDAAKEACSFSDRTIFTRFTKFLDHPLTSEDIWKILPPKTLATNIPWVYGCDGKWLGRIGVFFIHRNVTTKENLYWSFMKSESYEVVSKDCSILITLLENHLPVGAVSDWKGSIVSSVASFFGNIPHQRCLAHIDRDAKRLLPLYSPYEATQELRRIASLLLLVEKPTDVPVWQAYFVRWEKQYGQMLTEKTIAPQEETRSWWYTHRNLRRAWRLLTHDIDPLFVFLINPLIPKTNNALEGVNSNLKQKLGNHRGMSITRQTAFLSWYMAFTRSKSEQDLKKLWAYWKSKFSR